MASSDGVVKKREAARSSSSDKRLLSADMMSITHSRIFNGDSDGCDASKCWKLTVVEGGQWKGKQQELGEQVLR